MSKGRPEPGRCPVNTGYRISAISVFERITIRIKGISRRRLSRRRLSRKRPGRGTIIGSPTLVRLSWVRMSAFTTVVVSTDFKAAIPSKLGCAKATDKASDVINSGDGGMGRRRLPADAGKPALQGGSAL